MKPSDLSSPDPITPLLHHSTTPLSSEDWSAFLGRHDLTWDAVDTAWEQGAFLGNGMMGAMIYRENPRVMRWELGRCDVVESFQIPGVDWGPPRVLIGDFLLEPVGAIQREEMRQHLWNAEVVGVIETDRGTIRWRSLVHADDMALLIEWRTEGDEDGARLTFRPQHGISPCLNYERVRTKIDPEWLARHTPPAPTQRQEDGVRSSVQDFMGGGQYAVAWRETSDAPGHRCMYVSIANTFPGRTADEEARAQLASVTAQPLDPWVEAHRAWWHDFYPKSFLSMSDPYWEPFYWIQMYKLASATRADGALIDSQGPWMPQTPWPTCVWNLNVQTSYSPLFTSNRFELGESLYGKLDESLPDLSMNVPDPWKGDSAGIGRSSSCVSLKSPTSPGWETGNLTWVCFNYYRHYRCSMDEDLLRDRFYPMLRRAVNYYLHFMEEGEDGRIHLPRTHSPEYGHGELTRDANYDLALLRWGCLTLLRLSARLGNEDERRADWEDVLARLVDPPTDEYGLRVGRDLGFRKSHRHFSHLFSIWPLRLSNVDHPEGMERVQRSVDHWLSLDEELQGYTWTAASCMAAGVGEGDLALERLNELKPFLQPNTMYTENGPVIETPIAAAESIHDMILQSWTDPDAGPETRSVIRVFPAVPQAWGDVVFHDLRAEGAFLVGAGRKNGTTEWVQITSLAGEPCVVRTDLANPVATVGERVLPVTAAEDGTFSIPLEKGETVLLKAEGAEPELAVRPVARSEAFDHLFGMAGAENVVHHGRPAH